jgi:endonuclease/exonuclease/phosphatase family metal-dependent hydrolase
MRLCLISSNIRFDNPADGVNAWPHRRSLLSEILLKHSPDIIATQEGRYSQLVDFNELLRDFEIVDHHRSWIKERMYPTFFIRKNTFELIKSEDLWLSETPHVAGSASFGSAFPRLLTWMKIQPKDTDKNLIVVNTHLDHVKSETRLEQVKVLGKEIKKLIRSLGSSISFFEELKKRNIIGFDTTVNEINTPATKTRKKFDSHDELIIITPSRELLKKLNFRVVNKVKI